MRLQMQSVKTVSPFSVVPIPFLSFFHAETQRARRRKKHISRRGAKLAKNTRNLAALRLGVSLLFSEINRPQEGILHHGGLFGHRLEG